MGNSYRILVQSLKERDRSEYLGVNGRIIFKLIFGSLWIGFIWLRIGSRDDLL
jgi:hypothetical protein